MECRQRWVGASAVEPVGLEHGSRPACFSLAARQLPGVKGSCGKLACISRNIIAFALKRLPSCQTLFCCACAAAIDLAVLIVGGGAGDWLQPATLVQALNAWLRTFYYLQRLCNGEDSATIGQCSGREGMAWPTTLPSLWSCGRHVAGPLGRLPNLLLSTILNLELAHTVFRDLADQHLQAVCHNVSCQRLAATTGWWLGGAGRKG